MNMMEHMREIEADEITEAVARLCVESNINLNDDVYEALLAAKPAETSPIGAEILDTLTENAVIARQTRTPICQDTGMAVVFVEIGRDVHINGNVRQAVNLGVAKGYFNGYLRKSVVKSPFNRVNTGDNSPAIIHFDIVEGDGVKITVAPKGFGSENMSRVFMLSPSQGIDGARDCVIQAVKDAGGNPCPPIIVGVGIGGNFEYCAYLAKKALLRHVGQYSIDAAVSAFEKQLLTEINETGVGPQGFGGKTTALWAAVETYPTHIAGLPVAVNISCHVTRHAEVTI
jgi:fumarate hydratase subunit alpha